MNKTIHEKLNRLVPALLLAAFLMLMLPGTAYAGGDDCRASGQPGADAQVAPLIVNEPADEVREIIEEYIQTGLEYSRVIRPMNGKRIDSQEVIGELPPGMTAEFTDTSFTVSGVPYESGEYEAVFRCRHIFSGRTIDIPVRFIVQPPALVITKHPGSEFVSEGSTTVFIAAAQGYTSVMWQVTASDGTVCTGTDEIEAAFPGVTATAERREDYREYLTLARVPFSMNGCHICAVFTGERNPDETQSTYEGWCILSVTEVPVPVPLLERNPVGGRFDAGEPVVLYVNASPQDGSELEYQWYRADAETPEAFEPVAGAVGRIYMPELEEGETACFRCDVNAFNGWKRSPIIQSETAVVTCRVSESDITVPEPQEEAPQEENAPGTSLTFLDRISGRQQVAAIILAAVAVVLALFSIRVYLSFRQ